MLGMPWTVSNQPRSVSRESPGPSTRGSGRDPEERNQAGSVGQSLESRGKVCGICWGGGSQQEPEASIPNFSTGGREADGSRMATNTPPLM